MSESETFVSHVFRSMRAGLQRVLGMLAPERLFGGRIEYSAPAQSTSHSELVIGIIDDPELSMRLLSLRGRLTLDTIGSLACVLDEIDDCAVLHLDVTDADFGDATSLARVGRLLDDLEDRRVRVRIVGLSPLISGPVD